MSTENIIGIVVVLIALTLFSGIIYARWRYSNKFELTLPDVTAIIALVIVWMLGSNKISELAVGAEVVKVTTAIIHASAKPIRNQALEGGLSRCPR